MFFLIGYTQTKIPEAQRARDPAIPPEGIHLEASFTALQI